MNINRSIIAGFTGKDAWSSPTSNSKSMTRLSVATTKRYKEAESTWREKTQWHTCVAYGATAQRAARVQTGTHVLIEGELVYQEYDRTIETESRAGEIAVACDRGCRRVLFSAGSATEAGTEREPRNSYVDKDQYEESTVYHVDCACGYSWAVARAPPGIRAGRV